MTGALLFLFPNGALTHHLPGGQAVVSLPLVGPVRSSRSVRRTLREEGQPMPPFFKLPSSPVQLAARLPAAFTPAAQKCCPFAGTTCHLPAQTCRRQLCRRAGRCFPQHRPFSFVRGKRNKAASCGAEKGCDLLWQSIIWKQRLSAGAPGVPPVRLRPI